jgi:hypothetical protein
LALDRHHEVALRMMRMCAGELGGRSRQVPDPLLGLDMVLDERSVMGGACGIAGDAQARTLPR